MLSEFLKHLVAADREVIDTLLKKGMFCFDRESRKTMRKKKIGISCRDSRRNP